MINDAFAKVEKAFVESQLVGCFIDRLYHDLLCMKVMRENPKKFQAAVQSAFGRTKFEKEISIKVK